MTSAKCSLLNNSRFYILTFSVLISIFTAALIRLLIPSDQLFIIRTQQLFGLLCIFYWYAALIISPLGYVVGKEKMKRIEFSRRAIGVSAAYFAILHAVIALSGQLGGVSGVLTLSSLFQWSLAAGLVGVVVLSIMAATSFDKVIKIMTFPRWKWLHRLVYVGGILAVLHIWSVGTHVGYGWVQVVAFIALVVLAGLEMFRLTTILSKKSSTRWSMEKFNAIFLGSWAMWFLLIALIPKYVDTYRSTEANSSHVDHEGDSGDHEGESH